MTKPARLRSVAPSMWVVIRPNGEKYIVEREPLEGIDNWARGQNVVIVQFDYAGVRYQPPLPPTKSEART